MLLYGRTCCIFFSVLRLPWLPYGNIRRTVICSRHPHRGRAALQQCEQGSWASQAWLGFLIVPSIHGHPQSCLPSLACRRPYGRRLQLPLESSCPRAGTVSHVTRADSPTRAQADHTRTCHQFDPDKPSIVLFRHRLFHKPCPREGFYPLFLSCRCIFFNLT